MKCPCCDSERLYRDKDINTMKPVNVWFCGGCGKFLKQVEQREGLK